MFADDDAKYTILAMEWANDTVLHFLQLYRNEPVIWDISNEDHKNRMKVYDAWKRISAKLGDEEKYNVPELKRKKESLMASFRLYTKKVKESKRCGDGPYKPVWFAYEPMRKFLGDKYKPRSPVTSEAGYSAEDDESEIGDDMIEHADFGLDQLETQLQTESETNCPQFWNENEAMIPARCTFKTGTRKRKKSVEMDDLKEKIDTAYSMLIQSNVQKSAPPTSGEKDVCDIYGELVAAKLKLMDENARDFCMYRISNVFFKMKFPKDMS